VYCALVGSLMLVAPHRLAIMPLVFVGGIIAAVSIPAYQEYAKRAQTQQAR
jgi:hypothetical protein